MNYEIECDNCGSHNVVKVRVDVEPPKKKTIKMSEYKSTNRYTGAGVTNAVMVYHRYKLVCKNCGEQSKEFTE